MLCRYRPTSGPHHHHHSLSTAPFALGEVASSQETGELVFEPCSHVCTLFLWEVVLGGYAQLCLGASYCDAQGLVLTAPRLPLALLGPYPGSVLSNHPWWYSGAIPDCSGGAPWWCVREHMWC